jgi:glycosyltransferase involved in cell wall biosynthesis
LAGRYFAASSVARRCRRARIAAQPSVVPLMEEGALGGRSYEVLVHALPADEIQRRLDRAWQRWPAAQSLGDFRVGELYCNAEMQALRGARRLITPHVEAARHLRSMTAAPVELIEWCRPPRRSVELPSARRTRPTVAFPASALPRKGALELAHAMRELGWQLLVLGTPSSDPHLWEGIDVEHTDYRDQGWLARADVMVLPAYVEHSPRALLAAIEHGVPVVATPACGLPVQVCTEIPAGDVPALVQALRRAIKPGAPTEQPANPAASGTRLRSASAHRD